MRKCLLLIPRMGSGGAERVMATIANNLCRDHEVRIVSMTDAESFYRLEDLVEIVGLGQTVNRKNKLTTLFSVVTGGVRVFFSLRREVKQWKPDVVLSFLQSSNCMAIILKMLGGKYRLVVSERGDPHVRTKLNRWFEYHFYRKADAVVCQGKKVTEFFREKDRGNITVIPNPIAAEVVPPLFEGERRKTVVGVGRLDAQKNFPMLIRAFAALPENFGDYTLEIYGGGKDETKLQRIIDEAGLSERAFLMGVKQGVMHYIADTSLYVMSSDYEGFPNALVEAMATGLPVISTDFPTGVARDIVGEKNGIVINTGDTEALTEAMSVLLSDEKKRAEMCAENRKIAQTLSEGTVMALWYKVLFTEDN